MRMKIGAAAALLLAAGCTTIDPVTGERVNNNTGTGVIIGAITGAALGTLAGGDDGRNAAVGAVVGGLAGGLIGNYMDRQEAELRAALRQREIEVIREAQDTILIRMPNGVMFDVDRATIKSQFVPTLNEVSGVLREYPKTVVQIAGHTDSTGTDEYNQTLSENRALSVASLFINNGVLRERIYAQGFGETMPVDSNATADGRARNRRVEIRLRAVHAS